MACIREATINDKEAIYRLMEVLEGQKLDRENYSNIYDANLLNPYIFYIVYEKDGHVMGFISVHVQKLLHHTANIAEIQEFIVDEAFRGQGIGKCLFQKAKEIALENACTQLEVCCNQIRRSSHKFYESQGMNNSHYKFCLIV